MKKALTMKPKRNYKPGPMDNCQTPAHALEPLYPFLDKDQIIWESAAGERNLATTLYEEGYRSVGTDILTGQDFFEYEPPHWDVQVTNPPYGLKYNWLERSYELGKPFALLVPVEMLGSKKCQELMAKYTGESIPGAEIILLTQRINFKMPNKGWEGTAQFPVMWYTWLFNIGHQIVSWNVKERKFL